MSDVQMFYVMLVLVGAALVLVVYHVRKHTKAVETAADKVKVAAYDVHSSAVAVRDKIDAATRLSAAALRDSASVAAATAANAVKNDVADKLAAVSSDVSAVRTAMATHFDAVHESNDKTADSVDALHARFNESHAVLSAKVDALKPADKHDEPSKAAETAAK